MGQQVLSGPTSHAVGNAAAAIASVVGPLPTAEALAHLHGTDWPMTDAESLRGVALLAESRLSGETLGRIVADHRRLFVGTAQRGPVACAKAPATAAPSFARLRGDLVRAGALEPSVAAADLGDGLSALAVLLAVDTEVTRRLREALLGEHLLAWGASCLSRVQLGAQTFLYQGVATLGLGLLRHAGDGDHPGDALGSGE